MAAHAGRPVSRGQPQVSTKRRRVVDTDVRISDRQGLGASVMMDELVILRAPSAALTRRRPCGQAFRVRKHEVSLGVTAIEVMPLGQFHGDRNWAMTASRSMRRRTATAALVALKALVDAEHAVGSACC